MDHVSAIASDGTTISDYYSKPVEYACNIILDTLKAHCDSENGLYDTLFQDMIARGYAAYAADDHKKRLLSYITNLVYDIMDDSFSYINEINAGKRRRGYYCSFADYYFTSLGIMIGNEIALAPSNYIVFYRMVQENIILYEFNTLMLHLFADTPSCYHHDYSKPLSLICTPCIMPEEREYPSSVKEHLHLMKTEIVDSDMSKGVDKYLLSVNNCLSISRSDTGSFYRHLHNREASPFHFHKGYMVIKTWESIMHEFIQFFFGQSKEKAVELVDLILKKYKLQDFYKENYEYCSDGSDSIAMEKEVHDGHLIQICIPRECAEKFVYTSFSYGSPASLYELQRFSSSPNILCQSSFDEPPPNAIRKLSLQEVMSSTDMSKVQSRILGHPNLFLEHGAFAEVVSGSCNFNRKKFQDEMFQIMEPFIAKAHDEGKHLRFLKFKNDD